jgi:hypothetical protein
MSYLAIVILLTVGALWWFAVRRSRMSVATTKTIRANAPTDRALAQLQAEFERRMVEEQHLPDGIRGRAAYIYWNLMRNWFNQLNAAGRYDDTQAERVRQDWCEYLKLLRQVCTSRFLALEASSGDKATAHSEEADLGSRRLEFIQDAFAAAIGPEATEELRTVRSAGADAFDRTGKQPMAPNGHRYFPVSINPYVEKCQPVNPAPPQ